VCVCVNAVLWCQRDRTLINWQHTVLIRGQQWFGVLKIGCLVTLMVHNSADSLHLFFLFSSISMSHVWHFIDLDVVVCWTLSSVKLHMTLSQWVTVDCCMWCVTSLCQLLTEHRSLQWDQQYAYTWWTRLGWANCRSLLCGLVSTVQYPTISFNVCLSDSGCRPCAVEVGLWQCYMVGLPASYSADCGLCWMLQLSQSLVFAARLTSQTLLPVSTGCMLPSKLCSNWRSSSTELFTAVRLDTCLIGWAVLLTCCLRDNFGRQLATNLQSVRLSRLVTVSKWSCVSVGVTL